MQFSFNLSHPGGMRRYSPVGRLPGRFQLCSRKPYVPVSLRWKYSGVGGYSIPGCHIKMGVGLVEVGLAAGGRRH